MVEKGSKNNLFLLLGLGLVALLAIAYVFTSSVSKTNEVTGSKVEESQKIVDNNTGKTGIDVNNLTPGDKSNVIDPRNGKPITPNVLKFIDLLNYVNGAAVSGSLTKAKDIKKLYEGLWKEAYNGGISLRTVLTSEDIKNGINELDPNPSPILAIYDGSSDLEYCAVNETYFGVKPSTPGVLRQLLVPISCAEYTANR